MDAGPHSSHGRARDPSSPLARLPVVVLALAGLGVASYLTLFQLGLVAEVWEPFFGDGSRAILTSGISRMLPVPDASLGAAAYLLEFVSGVIGGRGRWRTAPWTVLSMALVAGLLALASMLLIAAQALVYHAWCTLCLASALISFAMIGAIWGEVLASARHVARVRRDGGSWWRAVRGGMAPADGVPG